VGGTLIVGGAWGGTVIVYKHSVGGTMCVRQA